MSTLSSNTDLSIFYMKLTLCVCITYILLIPILTLRKWRLTGDKQFFTSRCWESHHSMSCIPVIELPLLATRQCCLSINLLQGSSPYATQVLKSVFEQAVCSGQIPWLKKHWGWGASVTEAYMLFSFLLFYLSTSAYIILGRQNFSGSNFSVISKSVSLSRNL